MSKCDICYIISNGFSERMILHTDLIPELKKVGLTKISLILPVKEGDVVRNLEEKFGIKVYYLNIKHSFWSHEYLSLRTYVYEDINKNPALQAKYFKARYDYSGYNPWRRIRPMLYYGLNKLLLKINFLQKIFSSYEKFILRNKKLTRLIKEIDPKILVSTYPVNYVEGAGIRIAKDLKIPSVTHLSSWDNITCKGRFPAISEYFISWGRIMTEELKQYYNLNKNVIYEVGVPHFDKSKELVSREKMKCYLKELGLDTEKPYIFFGMSSPYFAPKEIDIVERLADQIERNIYGDTMQMIIRPHPQNVQGGMADKEWLPRLDSLQSNRVGINYPIIEETYLPWNVNEEDFDKLANYVSECSVLLNTGSTLSLEGIIHNKPVIVTLFDADYNMKSYNSAIRIKNYFHFKKLIDFNGVVVVYHYEALKAAILKCIKEPDFNKEKRDKALFMECGIIDGKSSERIANSFLDIIKKMET